MERLFKRDKASHLAIPKAITGLSLAFLVLAGINVLALILFLLHRDEVANTYRHLYPGLPLDQINAMVNQLVLSGTIPHILFALLLLYLAWMIRSGRKWVRITATVIVALEMVAHVFSLATLLVLPAEASAILTVEAIGLLIELTALWLLWFSSPSRTYFTSRKHR